MTGRPRMDNPGRGTAPPRRPAPRPGDGVWPAIWLSRWLVLQWVRRDFVVRYRQSALGLAWAVVQPALMLAVYGLVFVKVLHVHPQHGSYLVFAYCGLGPWAFFSNAVSWSMPSLVNASHIIRQVYFPRVVIPLAACGVVVVDLALSTVILLVLQVATAGHLYLSTLALIPLYAALVLGTAALAVIGALLGAFVRDIRFALPLLLQLVFIATPIMYPRTEVHGRWSWIFTYNPMARLVAAVRAAVSAGRWPGAGATVAAVAVCLVALVAAVVYSATVEDRLPDLL